MSRIDSIAFDELLAPVGAEVFFGDYWQRRVLSFDLTGKGREQVTAAVGALDILPLAERAQGGVQAWISNEQVLHSVIPVDVSTAEKAISIGATLYFIDLPMDRLKNGVAEFVGAETRNIIASIFLTPSGGGTSWHFDGNENFTVQLTGAKSWMVAAAPAVAAAPESYILGLRAPDSLAGLVEHLQPQAAQTLDMIPGRFLYVPRGVFHRTEANESSWSLNLSFKV